VRRPAVALLLLVGLVASSCDGEGPPPATEVFFALGETPRLSGELRGNGEVGVVLAHMFPADRSSWSEFSALLAQQGYRTLAFDFRGYGRSGGEKDIPEIWRDVLAAAAALREKGSKTVVVVGASMGGTAALVAAAQDPQAIDGVVTLSAPSTFMGLTAPPEILGGVTAPKLFVAADGDGSAAQTAQAFYVQSPPPKRVEIVPGTEHGSDLMQGRQSEVVRRLVTSFLEALQGQAP
jgi:pimeloyl-ACP methyl ester carboxylesterase